MKEGIPSTAKIPKKRIELTFICIILSATIGYTNRIKHDFILLDTVKIPANNKPLDSDSSNRYLHIGSVKISGNKRTRNSIIIRELRLKEGDIISESNLAYAIEKDRQKIFNLHLFNIVKIQPIAVDTGTVDLSIEVEERCYTFPITRFQLSDRNFNEWWQNYNHDLSRVNYGLKLYQYNLVGLNYTLLLKAQFGFQKNFQVVYKIPYINKKQTQGLILEFDYIDAKNISDRTIDHKLHFIKTRSVLRTTQGAAISYTYRKHYYLQHRVKYEYRYSTIVDTLLASNPNYFGEGRGRQQFDALTYEVSSDRSDVAAYPLKGYTILFGFQQAGIAVRQDLSKTSSYLKLTGYLDLTRNFYFSNLSYMFWSNPSNLAYNNYSTMGYDKIFIRGYEIYVIEGPQYFLSKTTLKKRVFSRTWHLNNWKRKQFNYLPVAIYLKTFADWGYVKNYPSYEQKNINLFLSDKLLTGAGFGADVVTGYDFAIRFEYTFTTLQNGFFLNFKKEF